jgi:uncharacterized protein (TIGR03067 family)
MVSRCLIVVAAGLMLYCLDSVLGQEKKADIDRIQGSWKMTKIEVEGKPPPPEYVEKGKFVFKNNNVSIYQDDKVQEQATFVLDSAKRPPMIDFTATEGPGKGKISYGIYRIEGDSLTICMAAPGAKRPTEFKGQGKAGVLRFERVKLKN